MSDDPALRLYAEHAGALAARWQAACDPAEVFAPVADHLPTRPQRIADIGAGPGRAAAWLAGQGHEVTAVEPVQPFRDMGREGDGALLDWLDDRLPDLARLRLRPPYDLALLGGVWHHVAPAQRGQEMSSLAAILNPGGRILLSLRQGAVDPARGQYPADPDEAADLAASAGLATVARREAASIPQQNRRAGISWVWPVLAI